MKETDDAVSKSSPSRASEPGPAQASPQGRSLRPPRYGIAVVDSEDFMGASVRVYDDAQDGARRVIQRALAQRGATHLECESSAPPVHQRHGAQLEPSGPVQMLVQRNGASEPGKRTLAESLAVAPASIPPVQTSANDATHDHRAVHAAAARGVATPATSLPHYSLIQRAFGRHDISQVKAHTGAEATRATAAMGAEAFATGHDVVLGDRADLHTVAHEAAHVVQQRGGVQLSGGVGQVGDAYERHADDVASLVVQGKSAEHLLDTMAAAPGASQAPAVQRVVGPRPESLYRPNQAWATWFQAMTEEEVRREAGRLGLSRGALEQMNEIVTRQGTPQIKIPASYGVSAPLVHLPASSAPANSASASSASTFDPLDGTQSPFRVDATPAPVDASAKPTRARKVRRRDVASPIKFEVLEKIDAERYQPSSRAKPLNAMEKAVFDACIANTRQCFQIPSGELAITIAPGRHVLFSTHSAELLGEEFSALYEVRYEEPEPRSGSARAAPDEDQDKLRGKREEEAPYAGPIHDLGAAEDYADFETTQTSSTFTSTIQSGCIVNQIIHQGPWAKGERSPSQMGVMAGQNAKNYFLDQFIYEGRGGDLPDREKQKDLAELGGRFEWLHVIGSSLGGPNVIGNLVCGTYDANTEMIALEHRIARWGARDYRGEFRPTAEAPIKIVGIAVLEGTGFVAKQIKMLVYHGNRLILERAYGALQENVLTKARYKQEEQAIEARIDAARSDRAENASTASAASSANMDTDRTSGAGASAP